MIAYVVSLFPCWSETFILREILALRARGIPIKVFSLRPPCEPLVHDEARRLLEELADGASGALLTREAAAARKRLTNP